MISRRSETRSRAGFSHSDVLSTLRGRFIQFYGRNERDIRSHVTLDGFAGAPRRAFVVGLALKCGCSLASSRDYRLRE